MNHRKFHGTTLVIAAAMLLGACGSANSPQQGAPLPQEAAAPMPAAPAPTPAAAPAPSQPETVALREFIDPVTGQPREPTAAELKALAAAGKAAAPTAATAPKPKETVLPNGMVAVEAGVKSEMKGCVQPDGRFVAGHDCKSDAAATVKKP
jgi:hypothetical protein